VLHYPSPSASLPVLPDTSRFAEALDQAPLLMPQAPWQMAQQKAIREVSPFTNDKKLEQFPSFIISNRIQPAEPFITF